MLKILIASEDGERLAELARLVSSSGCYQIMRLQAAPGSLSTHACQLRSADALIIDQPGTGSAQMLSIEVLRQQYADLPCILITQTQERDDLIRALRAGVSDVLTWPLERAQLTTALTRLETNYTPRTKDEARVVAFISSKGGAGSSVISSNIGYTLAAHAHKRVLLIDLNTQFSDTHFLVSNKTPPATLSEVCAQVDRLDDAFLEACLTRVADNFDILAGASDPIKAGEIKKDKIEYVLSLVSPIYDFVLVDVGQAINPLSIAVLDHSDQICVVVQPTIAFARTGRRLLDILHGLHYPAEKLRILLNRHGKRDELPRATLEHVFGQKLFHILPDDAGAVDDSICHGVPIAKEHRNSTMAKALVALADILATARENDRGAPQEKGFSLSKLFTRAKTSSPNIA
ncbi:AAA family ATPase [Ralstonia soli]|uniref:AAA family ATPase n=1 Tax=Ralstonia soli TaxID=2953896 RepID=A0ABT1AJP5_9RALS|nr:AAA family ATPase [Ralstonia soli]MCO5398538.1 AAA family ATPase [Ralstonia soli]